MGHVTHTTKNDKLLDKIAVSPGFCQIGHISDNSGDVVATGEVLYIKNLWWRPCRGVIFN